MKSNMPSQKDFSKVPAISGGIQRSVFNRSHTHKTTLNVDQIVPFYMDEILPGDSQDVKANIFARLSSALDFPIMDNIHLDTFFFFVPNRLLWFPDGPNDGGWQKFMGERENPDSSIDYTIPQVTATNPQPGQIMNYLGMPIGIPNTMCSFWARAYIKIWNEWFRDENIQDSIAEFHGDGPEDQNDFPMKHRGKRHDYFTSCLPYPQKLTSEYPNGVGIGLSGTAAVIGNDTTIGLIDDTDVVHGIFADGTTTAIRTAAQLAGDPVGTAISGGVTGVDTLEGLGLSKIAASSGMIADLSTATAILINDLRLAVATQQFLELNARGGTRYVELIKNNFGVTVPDYRLQRSEYLGGSTQMMNVNPVTQTGETGTNPQGHQAGYVTANSRSGYSKSFNEHGVILGLVNVRADLTYQQGKMRMLDRSERLDFYFPTFANLGEQAVLNKEIYWQNLAADELVFGYNEAWAEYRYYPSRISGKFSSLATGTLDAWHLSQNFTVLPELDDDFIRMHVPVDRVMAITTEPDVLFDSFIEIRHARPMPVFSVPGLGRL